MERKHQVFVSSTYRDLITERQHVIHALLELDCIPAGMELFPATDEDAWTLIKEVIDNSDYYLLIIAGKYGSKNENGISYTEMEFDYAVSTKKPIICFLHEDIDELTGSKIEKTEENQNRLKEFRKKAESKHCKYWKTPDDLGGKVSRSLIQLKKKHPSDGWVPGKYAADEKLYRKIDDLRTRIQELENEKEQLTDSPPEDSKFYAQGSETFSQPCRLWDSQKEEEIELELKATWDQIFAYAGTAMIGECTEAEFRDKIKLVYWHAVPDEISKSNSSDDIIIYHVVFDTIKIQLQALGLITYGSKKRAVSDKNTYWRLTSYGEKYLLQVRAIKSKLELEVPF
ncbi:DUF4062 domain-containing protein [Tenacibaculum sp. 190524A05c]|uniref:DUF4062 domain-containing protein n=1 Tax=Tenacibaculum platacis TaxID=3137852 RepID=UPI0031FB346B